MIIGTFVRNFKIYENLFFIPFSQGENFTGIIGENGVGKSTVLQILDTFFNKAKWQRNIHSKNSPEAFIEPVCLIPKSKIPNDLIEEAEAISSYLWEFCNHKNINTHEAGYLKYFRNYMISFSKSEFIEDYYLLTTGVDSGGEGCEEVFEGITVSVDKWLELFRSYYNYIFVPTTPEPETIFGNCKECQDDQIVQKMLRLTQETFKTESPELLDAGEKLELIVAIMHDKLRSLPDKFHIIGFDEPEATLQTSLCYGLFEKIYKLDRDNVQILLTSHWYGFIPIMTFGMLLTIVRQDKRTHFLRFDISRYREEIKIRKRIFMEKYHEELPLDIELKSANDFVQSVLGSVINKPYYNWLICEGSSEKIYFNYYFEDLIKNKNLRIVPVGGVREVKKTYFYLAIPYEDLKDYISGKVVLLTDTDTQLMEFDTHAIYNLYCYRIVNYKGKTVLAHIKANPKSPSTEIEDVLNGKVFHMTLLHFKSKYPQYLDFIDENEHPETPSYYSLDLSPSQREKLTLFFDHHHQIKTKFAAKYIEICKQGNYKTPEWIEELRELFG